MTGNTDDAGDEVGDGEQSANGVSHDGRATLLCTAPDGVDRGRLCADLLAPESADTVDLLCVSFSGLPALDPEALPERGLEVDRTAFVLVGADADEVGADLTFAVESIESVDHLSDLGMYVRDLLSDWSVGRNSTVLCFDSVNDLIERADLELAFEFLLVLVEGNRRWDVTSHFHFDPAAADERTWRTLSQLFDVVIEAGDGHA